MGSILINNSWCDGKGTKFSSLKPSNQEVLWHDNAANSEQINQAINAAKKAYTLWSKFELEQRQRYIKKYIDILATKQEEFAKVIALENGKPLWEAKTEVAAMLAKYDASVKSYEQRTGTVSSQASMLSHRPIGVMAVFGPFNFPGHLPNGHIIPALLAGNTVVFKPSDMTPLVGETMARYWLEAGLPAGVFNLIQGGAEQGRALIASPDINGVLFTGSYNTGKLIHQQLAGRPEVMLALEMGGNNPLIIDNDLNNIDAVVYNIILSVFITAGQRCTCARRLYIPNTDLGHHLLERLGMVTNNLAISDGINHLNLSKDQAAFMGPVISLNAAKSIINFKNNLLQQVGVKELCELKLLASNSALLTPGIVLHTTKGQALPDLECFGPLLQVFYYDSFDEAIERANQTHYGLSAGLFSHNRNNFDKFYKFINAGIVNWNKPTTGAVGSLPFGGIGHSGNYRPGAYYAADYCAYPVATQYSDSLELPASLSPGINF